MAPVSNSLSSSLGEAGFSPVSPRKQDLFHVTALWAEEKPFSLLKALYVLPDFFIKAGFLPEDNTVLNNWCHGTKVAKLSRGPFELPNKMYETLQLFSKWVRGETNTFKQKYSQINERKVTIPDIGRSLNNWVSPFYEIFELFTKTIFYIPKSAITTLNGINGASLILSMGWNAIESLNWVAENNYSSLKGVEREMKFSQMSGYLFKLAAEVSFIVLGVLTVLSVFFGFVFSPLLFSTFAASSVVFGILEYYHENLGANLKKVKI